MPDALISLVPQLEAVNSLPIAFAAFMAGVVILTVLTLILGQITLRPRHKGAA